MSDKPDKRPQPTIAECLRALFPGGFAWTILLVFAVFLILAMCSGYVALLWKAVLE